MSVYRYTARTSRGALVSGNLAIGSKGELERHLRDSGLLLVAAEDHVSGARLGQRGIPLSAMLGFVRELRTLLGAGVTVVQALGFLVHRPDAPALSAAVDAMLGSVKRGRSLAEAAAEQPDIFEPLFRAVLAVGSQTGRLENALDHYIRFLSARAEMSRKIRRALAYPVFLMLLLVVVLAGLMIFVLPRFSALYADFGAELPAATRVLIATASAAPITLPILFGSILVASLALRAWRKTPSGKLKTDRSMLSIPFAGGILTSTSLVQISYLMSLLLAARTPVPEALKFSARNAGNTFHGEKLATAATAVSSGKELGSTLRDADLFPQTALSLIEAGEMTGALPLMFEQISILIEQDLDDRMSKLASLMEPALTLLFGVVVGTVIIVVYLPIFGIAEVIQ